MDTQSLETIRTHLERALDALDQLQRLDPGLAEPSGDGDGGE